MFSHLLQIYKIVQKVTHSNMYFNLKYSFSQALGYCEIWASLQHKENEANHTSLNYFFLEFSSNIKYQYLKIKQCILKEHQQNKLGLQSQMTCVSMKINSNLFPMQIQKARTQTKTQ